MGNFQSCKKKDLDLEKQVTYLKGQNSKLIERIETFKLLQKDTGLNNKSTIINDKFNHFLDNIDDKTINDLVDNILKNDSINFTIIPDEVEKAIYHNVIKLVISIVKSALLSNINIDNKDNKD